MRVSGGSLARVAAACLAIGVARGQPAPPTAGPHFDSATVRARPPGLVAFRAVFGTAIQGEVRLTDATLMECLRFAFGITNNLQIVGPDWMRYTENRYNVIGKAPADTPIEELHRMLQNLLIERFQMALHHESRELAYMALVASKSGLKMPPANPRADTSGNAEIPGRIVSNSMSIAQLTTLLSRFLQQPVLDLTGLQGLFDVKLEWQPDSAQGLSGALEGQLGLSLESRKGPLDVIVVDRAEKKPVGN